MDSSGRAVAPLVGVPGAGEDAAYANGEAEPCGEGGWLCEVAGERRRLCATSSSRPNS